MGFSRVIICRTSTGFEPWTPLDNSEESRPWPNLRPGFLIIKIYKNNYIYFIGFNSLLKNRRFKIFISTVAKNENKYIIELILVYN